MATQFNFGKFEVAARGMRRLLMTLVVRAAVIELELTPF